MDPKLKSVTKVILMLLQPTKTIFCENSIYHQPSMKSSVPALPLLRILAKPTSFISDAIVQRSPQKARRKMIIGHWGNGVKRRRDE